MNEVLKTIEERFSCRAYTNRPLTDGELDAIAKAAIQSPSAVNRQPWRVIIATNKELLAEIEAEAMANLAKAEDKSSYERIMSRGGKIYYDTPCIVFVAVDKSDYALVDMGILCENVSLAAASMGLGSVICGMIRFALAGEKAEYFKQKLGVPEGFEIAIAVLVGEAVRKSAPHEPDESKVSFIK